jgi:alkylation response protein AidB-like acyl-CoA dehydrogenase
MRDVPERPLPDPWGKNRACSSYLLDDARGYKPEIWAMMAELGWLGLLLPEEYGGGR